MKGKRVPAEASVESREEAQDALTVNVKPKKSSSLTERLAYDVTDKGFTLRWENTEVPVAIK